MLNLLQKVIAKSDIYSGELAPVEEFDVEQGILTTSFKRASDSLEASSNL